MRALVCNTYGLPSQVLSLQNKNEPKPGDGEVLVRMLLSPVNPSDLLFIKGKYGNQPTLPQVPGFEGVGIVEAGKGLLAWRVMGKRVSVIGQGDGRWQEKIIIPARQAVPVPSYLSDQQAASFFVNPATAYVMTQKVLKVPGGAWLLQSAATGALGRMIVRLGKRFGFKTINIVRKKQQAEILRNDGADAVISLDQENIQESVMKITNGKGVSYAVDAVGGEVGSQMILSLARNGKMLVYGRMSGEPLKFEPGDIMKGQKTIQGFWLSEWAKDQGVLTMLGLFGKLGSLIREGVLDTPAGSVFELDNFKNALIEAESESKGGKIYLRINPS